MCLLFRMELRAVDCLPHTHTGILTGLKIEIQAVFNCAVGVLLYQYTSGNDDGGGERIHRKLSNLIAVGMCVYKTPDTGKQHCWKCVSSKTNCFWNATI